MHKYPLCGYAAMRIAQKGAFGLRCWFSEKRTHELLRIGSYSEWLGRDPETGESMRVPRNGIARCFNYTMMGLLWALGNRAGKRQ